MLRTIEKTCTIFNLSLGRTTAWLSLVMVIVMCINVFMRYALNGATIWQQELVQYAFAMLILCNAGYTLFSDKHVRVDIFYQRFSKPRQALINVIGTCVFIVPMACATIYFSFEFVLSSWQIHESSSEYNGMPGVFLLKSGIWLFALTLIIQSVATICRYVRKHL